MSGPYLDVSGLTIRAANRPLVHDVSFQAHKGRVTGLIGESGSGKSLTCQAVLGLVPAGLSASGTVRLGSTSIPLESDNMNGARAVRGTKAAMVLQNPMSCFDPLFTMAAHFRETMAAHGFNRDRNSPSVWRQALASVSFDAPDDVLPLYPFQMSGGMLQRVMIALALVLEAEFLLADEATTDLDAVAQGKVLDLLEGLVRERGVGVLLVTHDLSVVARLADEVLVMRHGKLVEHAPVRDIFTNPGHGYTLALLEAHHRLYGAGHTAGAAADGYV